MEPTDINKDIAHIAPLNSDDIPNDNQAHYCFSCEEPIRGSFCIACGQKNDDLRRSVFSLTWELITSVTAIEGRIWRTWRTLLIQPGRVAREFANGRRSYWSSPIRVYLAMSIVLFTFMGCTNTHLFGVDIDVKPKDGMTITDEDITAKDLDLKFSTQWFPRQKEIDARNVNKNYALIEKKLQSYAKQGFFESEDLNAATEIIESKNTNNVENQVNAEDEALNIDELNIQINNRKLDSNLAASTFVRFSQNPTILTNSFNKLLPRAIFIIMPFTILFSALFIRGRENAMLYDHLVHAAYIHAVAFLALFIGIAFSTVINGGALFSILFIGLVIYLPLSLKRMFNRGWVKTLWTSYAVGFVYLAVLLASLFVAIIIDIGKNLTL